MSKRDKRWTPRQRRIQRIAARLSTVHREMGPSEWVELAEAIRDTLERKNLIGPCTVDEMFQELGI